MSKFYIDAQFYADTMHGLCLSSGVKKISLVFCR